MEYGQGQADRQRTIVRTTTGSRADAARAISCPCCDAVQHARASKGIIHHDLKPSNILVATPEIDAWHPSRPKVIDFGIAKAATASLTDKYALHPASARSSAPEGTCRPSRPSLAGKPTSTPAPTSTPLGVVLYELLTGDLPFDPPRPSQQGYDEVRRNHPRGRAPKPSTWRQRARPHHLRRTPHPGAHIEPAPRSSAAGNSADSTGSSCGPKIPPAATKAPAHFSPLMAGQPSAPSPSRPAPSASYNRRLSAAARGWSPPRPSPSLRSSSPRPRAPRPLSGQRAARHRPRWPNT